MPTRSLSTVTRFAFALSLSALQVAAQSREAGGGRREAEQLLAAGIASDPRRNARTEPVALAHSQTVISYTLRVDSGNLSGFDVQMRIRNVPDTFQLAMAAHPEYDDQFWRFVEGLTVATPSGNATIVRRDSALWRVVTKGGDALVRYRIRLPAAEGSQRASWRPFLSPTGGLVGGPHAFMYMLGATFAPSHVRLELPQGWLIATGLEPTSDPNTFFAPTAYTLIDSPILVGRLKSWNFAVDAVPHRVAYWPLPNATAFDTTTFVGGIERLAREAIALFAGAPYREFTFLFQDGAYGGLEHLNSVTMGAPSAQLASDPTDIFEETGHEYVHTWNLMRIRPAERGTIDYRPNGRTRGLWWSEGLTMFYADLLLRRAGVRTSDSTRTRHLERLIASYLFNPGYTHISAERTSLAEYGSPPNSLGGYDPSPHLQGELLGAMLDLVVRDATDGRRSIDDVMKAMMQRYSGARGFSGQDIERTVTSVCGCAVGPFFDAHVRGAKAIDFNRYLRLAGLRTQVSWTPALGRDGQAATDYRLRAWLPPGETSLSLLITDPGSVWGRAGLLTNDRIVAVNGAPMMTGTELRAMLSRVRIGDTVTVDVRRPRGPARVTVVVAGYNRPVVRIDEIPDATESQRKLRARWLSGAP